MARKSCRSQTQRGGSDFRTIDGASKSPAADGCRVRYREGNVALGGVLGGFPQGV
jgi:hypothetical protein